MSEPRLLSNRYEIDDTLGYGGMSEVHSGRDIRLGRDVAVKVLRADLARDPTFQTRFRREAQNAAALNHPAIVAVYDTGETDSENGPLPYIVMEYVDGRTLRDIVKSEGPLPPRRAMEVMADASAALDFSHRHAIVHRDVKPANIMITRSGAVKVMDFGIARALDDGQASVTQTAAVIGTAQYLSPEQARGEAVDARSDVYASGCVLFELLTGEPPFTGDSPVAVAYQHVREDPRKPSDVTPQVPASLDAVVLKALSKNPANRYQSAAEMRADLVRVLSGQRPKAPMVMSEEEHTSMLEQSAPTEAMDPGGRHRPESTGYIAAEDEAPRRNRKHWLTALVTAACVGVFALVAWLATGIFDEADNKTELKMPDFRGMTKEAAAQKATADRLKFEPTTCNSSAEQVGIVVDQKPAPQVTIVRETDRVQICSGIGPKDVQVPDLAGMTVDEAFAALDKVNLKMAPTPNTVEVDDPSQFGKVVEWEHRGGTIGEGSTINVTVGREAEQTSVLSVVNMPFESAKSALEANGFTVKRENEDSHQPSGTVISQSPEGGSQVKPGSEVTLVVSNGSQLEMPSLVGKSESEAKSALEAAGWSGKIVTEKKATTNEAHDNKVVESSPASGETLGKDQTVTLYIGDYESTPSSQPTDGSIFPPFD
ncbi:Stk1 family PASTA domain-containing Ser/Thr kinase [Parasphingorhabdus pacifica]